MHAALANASPFLNMPHVLDTARAELLAAQAELHRARQKKGKRTFINAATKRLYSALDAVHAAQEQHASVRMPDDRSPDDWRRFTAWGDK